MKIIYLVLAMAVIVLSRLPPFWFFSKVFQFTDLAGTGGFSQIGQNRLGFFI